MALNIKDPITEKLITEIAELTGKSKVGAIRDVMQKELSHLIAQRSSSAKDEALLRLLQEEIWPQIPEDFKYTPIPKEELEDILGYGPEGV